MKTDIARTAWDVEKSFRITTGMYPVEFCGAPQAWKYESAGSLFEIEQPGSD